MARNARTTRIFSTTDPDARLFRKGAGKEAKLCHMGHLMMENRNGLIVDARLTEANGTAERSNALDTTEGHAGSRRRRQGPRLRRRIVPCAPHVLDNEPLLQIARR